MISPDRSIHSVNQTSPISIGVPSGEQADLVLDMGASFGLDLDLFESIPSLQRAFFKNLAVGAVNCALGGVVPGIYRQEFVDSKFEANQGSMIIVIDVGRLLPLAELKGQMDKFVASAEAAQPLPGEEAAYLPGGREAKFKQEFLANGIGLTLKVAQGLQEIGDMLGVVFPWERLPAHPSAKHAPPTARL